MRLPEPRAVGWVLVGLAIATLIVTGVASALVSANNSETIRDQSEAIRAAQKTNTETLELIRSCTQVGGRCYEKSQKQTARVVADLGKVAAYAAACADNRGVQGQEEVLACVLRHLAAEEKAKR